jgi:hypothetical protein
MRKNCPILDNRIHVRLDMHPDFKAVHWLHRRPEVVLFECRRFRSFVYLLS